MQLFLGLESISQQSVAEMNKGFNRVEGYFEIIERIHSHGIAAQAGIIFGFDNDTPEIFDERSYSLPSIAKRLSRSSVQLWWTLPLNLAYSYRWRKTA
jgi:radical SAM superfamily enzyme